MDTTGAVENDEIDLENESDEDKEEEVENEEYMKELEPPKKKIKKSKPASKKSDEQKFQDAQKDAAKFEEEQRLEDAKSVTMLSVPSTSVFTTSEILLWHFEAADLQQFILLIRKSPALGIKVAKKGEKKIEITITNQLEEGEIGRISKHLEIPKPMVSNWFRPWFKVLQLESKTSLATNGEKVYESSQLEFYVFGLVPK